MLRVCLNCGVEFDGRPDSTLCPVCAAASKAASVIRPRTCRQCGVVFDGGPRAWYCPDCRRERQLKAQREAKQRKRAGKTRTLGSTDYCARCGKPYTVEGPLQKYCRDCAPIAVAEIDRAAGRKWAEENIDYRARTAARQQATAEIICEICGKPFVPDSAAKTCSPECAAELKRRNFAQWEREKKDVRNEYHRQKIAEKLAAMSPEARKEYQEKANRKARENYKRRKNNDQ